MWDERSAVRGVVVACSELVGTERCPWGLFCFPSSPRPFLPGPPLRYGWTLIFCIFFPFCSVKSWERLSSYWTSVSFLGLGIWVIATWWIGLSIELRKMPWKRWNAIILNLNYDKKYRTWKRAFPTSTLLSFPNTFKILIKVSYFRTVWSCLCCDDG